MNVDETALERVVPRRFGNVINLPQERPVTRAFYERIPRRDSHGHVTLVAAVSHPEDLQPTLPQIILTRDDGLTAREKARLQALAPPLLWLEGSEGWTTGPLFCKTCHHFAA